jgi:hypothetical protein
MRKARLLIAGLIVPAGMMSTDASAQNCPEWLQWACPNNATPNTATQKGSVQSQRPEPSRTKSAARPRTKQAARAGAQVETNPKARQTQRPGLARLGTATRPIPAGGGSGGRRTAPQMQDGNALTEQERSALFQQFLVWQEKQRRETGTVGDGSSR